jgi:hypothetical protein
MSKECPHHRTPYFDGTFLSLSRCTLAFPSILKRHDGRTDGRTDEPYLGFGCILCPICLSICQVAFSKSFHHQNSVFPLVVVEFRTDLRPFHSSVLDRACKSRNVPEYRYCPKFTTPITLLLHFFP